MKVVAMGKEQFDLIEGDHNNFCYWLHKLFAYPLNVNEST